jgi:hypothetical protein
VFGSFLWLLKLVDVHGVGAYKTYAVHELCTSRRRLWQQEMQMARYSIEQ